MPEFKINAKIYRTVRVQNTQGTTPFEIVMGDVMQIIAPAFEHMQLNFLHRALQNEAEVCPSSGAPHIEDPGGGIC